MATKNKQKEIKKMNKLKEKLKNKPKEMEIFLMLEKEVTSVEISNYYREHSNILCDQWPALNIFELEYAKEKVADFEPIDIKETFVDEADIDFLKNRNINTVYTTLIEEEYLMNFVTACNGLLLEFGGVACADSDDFQPMFVGKE